MAETENTGLPSWQEEPEQEQPEQEQPQAEAEPRKRHVIKPLPASVTGTEEQK